MTEYRSRAFAPFVAQRGEIRISFVEPAPHPDLEAVMLVANEVDGHAYRQVAAHGRVEWRQHTLRRVNKGSRTGDHAVDDRFAVFGFAGLQVRCVEAGFDEIALGVDPKEPQRLPSN